MMIKLDEAGPPKYESLENHLSAVGNKWWAQSVKTIFQKSIETTSRPNIIIIVIAFGPH